MGEESLVGQKRDALGSRPGFWYTMEWLNKSTTFWHTAPWACTPCPAYTNPLNRGSTMGVPFTGLPISIASREAFPDSKLMKCNFPQSDATTISFCEKSGVSFAAGVFLNFFATSSGHSTYRGWLVQPVPPPHTPSFVGV